MTIGWWKTGSSTWSSNVKTKLLTIQAAATHLGVHRSFLDRRRVAGGGPRYIRLSARVIRYDPDDLDEWLAGSRRANTSEISEAHADA